MEVGGGGAKEPWKISHERDDSIDFMFLGPHYPANSCCPPKKRTMPENIQNNLCFNHPETKHCYWSCKMLDTGKKGHFISFFYVRDICKNTELLPFPASCSTMPQKLMRTNNMQ